MGSLTTGAVVLAGGRSSRMGTPKADLRWRGTTLAHHVAALVADATGGPVVVVRAAGQALPALPAGVAVAQDARPGRGPVQGIAAGLGALEGAATIAFVCAVDMPLLHADFVRAVCAALGDEHDVALPVVGGRRQPLAAAWRVSLHALADQVAAGERRGTGAVFARCRVRELHGDALPHPESVTSLDDPEAYARARSRASGT
jgi:molybdopterin-guanine dinucleotide biosynthesis protein A